jgi:hypothetical protein
MQAPDGLIPYDPSLFTENLKLSETTILFIKEGFKGMNGEGV